MVRTWPARNDLCGGATASVPRRGRRGLGYADPDRVAIGPAAGRVLHDQLVPAGPLAPEGEVRACGDGRAGKAAVLDHGTVADQPRLPESGDRAELEAECKGLVPHDGH